MKHIVLSLLLMSITFLGCSREHKSSANTNAETNFASWVKPNFQILISNYSASYTPPMVIPINTIERDIIQGVCNYDLLINNSPHTGYTGNIFFQKGVTLLSFYLRPGEFPKVDETISRIQTRLVQQGKKLIEEECSQQIDKTKICYGIYSGSAE